MLFLNDLLNLLGDTTIERILSAVLLAIFAYLTYRWILQPVYDTLAGMLNFWTLRKKKAVFLEIAPPTQSDKSPVATQQLFAILQRQLGRWGVASLELVSSRAEGIRYLIRVLPDEAAALQRHVASYLPDVRFRTFEDGSMLAGAQADGKHCQALEVKQSRHYAYPLQPQKELELSDPIAYIAGAMAKLQSDEAVALQMVVAPHYSYWTSRLYNKIHSRGYALIDGKLRYFLVKHWWIWVIAALVAYYGEVKVALSWAFILLCATVVITKVKGEEPVPSAAEQELYAGVLEKLGQPLFRTDIRILVEADNAKRLDELSSGVSGSLAPQSTTFQHLYVPWFYRGKLGQKLSMFKLRHRVPSFLIFDSNILSASELASIYHFPYGDITTEGMARSHSRTLAAPLAIKNGKFDVLLGRNKHHGETNAIGLTAKERERHAYIIGGTGNGKTTMLQYAIVQDIENGKGVAVVDPHGDLAETILRHIPKDRIKDVVYFNPADVGYPIGLNLLEIPGQLTGDDRLLAQDFATEAIVSIFRKIFSEDDSGGHRIESILRNAVHTAFTVEDATLFTVQKLLTNADYRKPIVAKLEDEGLKDFWLNEFGKSGNYQKVKMISGVTAKIGRFQRSVAARRILEQVKSTIDFDDILDGKILICNLSKGLVGEDTSEVFGIGILAKLQLAAYRRIHKKEADRRPFYLYVDEFQNFATPLFMQMLSESRKYKMFLTMAEQSTSQQEEQQMVETILANVGTVVAFRSGNPADEEFLLPLFRPYIEEGEISKLPSFNFCIRVMGVKPQEPFSGETILLEDKGSEAVAEQVIAASRANYATRYEAPTPRAEKVETERSGQTGKPRS